VVEVVHCHMGPGHAHVWQIPQGCRALGPHRSLYAPSAIMRFASLDTCISPVDYDVSFT
jgi:hypothetical protein